MISFTKEECKEIINMIYIIPGVIRDGAHANVDRPNENISYKGDSSRDES